jgi:hypothetical protein
MTKTVYYFSFASVTVSMKMQIFKLEKSPCVCKYCSFKL